MDNDKKKGSPVAAQLRRRAEEQLQGPASQGGAPPAGDANYSRLLHELQVHQIELELQNAELRQARDDVETMLGNYAELYDFAPVGYVTLAPDGTVRAANLTAGALLGTERSRLLGRNIAMFIVKDTRPLFATFLGKVFSSQGKESCEVALTTTGIASLFVQIEAVLSASGQECRAILVDITRRRQLEEKLLSLVTDLDARAAELAAANVELEAFNYSVSHDLRRPLTVINGYCQVLRDLCCNQLDAESLNYINEMYEGSLKMNRLINTLLQFSSVTRVEMSTKKVDLSKVVESIATGLTTGEPERSVTFQITPGIVAPGDADLLFILFNNLLGNAWKYAGSQEKTVIEFGMIEQGDKPVYFVRDNGPGFDMAMSDKLFVPFQRLTGTGVEGYGIGLATVERIVKRHGGRVWAESEQGRGATFFFTLA